MSDINRKEELHIKNKDLEQRLQKDLERYEIIYIQAPRGWGKYTFLQDYAKKTGKASIYWLEETREKSLQQKIRELPSENGRIIIIPKLELILQKGMKEDIWKLIRERRKGDRFLFASTVPLPEELLSYVAARRLIVYGIRELRPSNEEVRAYFAEKDIELGMEELLRIEKDLYNMPLCIYMLENPLRNSARGYCRAVREQCLGDVYAYMDVTFFRSFRVEEQDALLQLACFEEITEELIGFVLNWSAKQVKAFLEMLFGKGSILEPCGKRVWRYERLFSSFLSWSLLKYMDVEGLTALYRRAEEYYMEQGDYLSALRFGSLLKDYEQMAENLHLLLKGKVNSQTILSLEDYFAEIPLTYLRRYPNVIAAGSMMESLNCNRSRAKTYRQILVDMSEECQDAGMRAELQMLLIYLDLCSPGGMTPESLREILEKVKKGQVLPGAGSKGNFVPNHISVLHGDNDFSCFLMEGVEAFLVMDEFQELLEKMFGRGFAGIKKFQQAEIFYEYNQLDESLDMLSKCQSEARAHENRNMQMLCSMKLGSLLVARNQAEGVEAFLLQQMEEELEAGGLRRDNYAAHRIYFYLLSGNSRKIMEWMKERAPDERGRFYSTHYYQYLMKAKVYIWQGQNVLARMILGSLLEFAGQYGMYYLGIQARMLEAVIYFREENELWEEKMAEALEMGRKIRFIRVFADEGAAVYELLQSLGKRDKNRGSDAYFQKVLTAVRAQMLLYPKYLKREKGQEIQSLSSYEQDVLRLLVIGEKNARIAQILCVSENTVKYHLKNIYQKLGVKSRSQAVKMVSEYHLL
ncbi:MAG: hypothetical protein KH452_12920 [Clostridiales bacterium]|nr:hypothetical protein [Clostridiales bacterium]